MAESARTIEQVRAELESERRLLDGEIGALREEARAVLPYAAGGVAVLALLTKGKGVRRAYRLLSLLR